MSDIEVNLFDVSEFGTEEDDASPLGQGASYLGEYTGPATVLSAKKSERESKDPAFESWEVVFQAPSKETIKKSYSVPIANTFMYRKDPSKPGNLFPVRMLGELLKALGYEFSSSHANAAKSFAILKKVFVAQCPLVGKQVKIEVKFPHDKYKIEKVGLEFALIDAEGKIVVQSKAERIDPADLNKKIQDFNVTFTGTSRDAVKSKLAQYGYNASDLVGYHEVKSVSAPDVVVKSVGSLDAHSSVNDLL